MADDFVKQHIVPRRYLDRFGTPSGKRTLIGTRVISGGKVKFYIESTENVGYLKNFYDVTDKSSPKHWEHFLGKEIDSLCGRDIQNIIAKIMLSEINAIVLSEHEKRVLAKIIVAQLSRIPNSLEYVTSQLYPKISKQVKEQVASFLPPILLEKYEDRIKNAELPYQQQKELLLNHAFAPENFERYCRALQEGIWIVYINVCRSTTPFITSDNPVLVEGVGNTKTGLFHNGLANPATCIFFPLSPEIAVAVYSRQGFWGIATKEYDGKKFLLNDVKYIIGKNIKIADQAHRYLFLPQPLYDEIANGSSMVSDN